MVCYRSMLWVTTVVGKGQSLATNIILHHVQARNACKLWTRRSWVQIFPFMCQSAITDWVLRNSSTKGSSISASTSFWQWLLGALKSLPVMKQSIMVEEMWVPHASREEGKRERSAGRKLSLPRGILSEPLPQPDPTLRRPSSSKSLRKLVPSESHLGAPLLNMAAWGTTRSVHGSL